MSFNVLLVGAGEINFGSVEGPWNHTLRLERKLGDRLRIIGLIDPDTERAANVLNLKRSGDMSPAYVHCKIFSSIEQAAQTLHGDDAPRLTVVGAPPAVRGSDIPGRDLEVQIVHAFPATALFVEKPVSSGPADACWRVCAKLTSKQTLGDIGKAVQMMRQIIKDNNLTIMGTNARYVMAYEYARKLTWWDKAASGGPIVEQGTHFCDLSRFFGGDVSLPSVKVHTVEHNEAPGSLLAKRFNEDEILAENRLPRLTSAVWKYTNGAVGSLTHVIALHGTTYDTEFEVYADGYRLKLIDPYNSPVLSIRRPGNPGEEMYRFSDDDPFYSELSTFIDAIKRPEDRSNILSTYDDAIKTYELTWRIRTAGEAAAASNEQA